jgi:AraC-like DNA-binding protein
MRTMFEKVPQGETESFVCEELRGPNFGTPWHVHPEYELTLLCKGQGYRMVADNITPLAPGDLVLVGPHLPHVWQAKESGDGVHWVVVQFREDFLGADFFSRPETRALGRVLRRAALGMVITGRTRDLVAEQMHALVTAQGFRRMVGLLEILNLLANSPDVSTLCSAGYVPKFEENDEARVSRVCQYLNDNLAEPISRTQIARSMQLSDGGFSRFFKTRTGKTLPEYLNELRVGRACRLLTEQEKSITEIALSCGYGNLSNFNRQFKRLKGLTPRDYRGMVR